MPEDLANVMVACKFTQEHGIGAVTSNTAWIPIQPLIGAGGLIFLAGSYWGSAEPGPLPVESPA
jgi:hypothetical protein